MNKLTTAILSLCALTLGAVATHGAQFFRIVGPVATTITALSADGHITWTNSPTNATFTVQTTQSLPGLTNWVDYIQVPVANAVTTQRIYDPSPPSGMAFIPAGSFTMGNLIINGNSITNDPDITDANPTNVYVSAFYMDVNLVSYSLWQSVYNWATNAGYGFGAGSGHAANYPVMTVEWYDTVKWCNARSQQAGLTPVYYMDAGLTQVYTNGQAAPYVNWAANGYRLPTEAEWEKAARGGLTGQRFPWGNTISESQANYLGEPDTYSYDLGPGGYNHIAILDGGSTPAGCFPANGYGLYDMAGNVGEWCWDWYGTPYAGGSDPHEPASTSEYGRVVRLNDWTTDASEQRCAHRAGIAPTSAYNGKGFRSVRGF